MRALVLALLAACGAVRIGDPDAGRGLSWDGPGLDGPAASCEVGTGYEAFEPIADGGEVAIVAGPQGGFHIFTSVRVRGLDPATARAEVAILADGAPLGPAAVAPRLAEADRWLEAVGLVNFLPDPSAARGREIVLRAVARDDADGRASDERRAVARQR